VKQNLNRTQSIYIYISIHLHTHKQRFSHACVSSCVNLRVCICVHENAASDASGDCACNAGYTGPNGGTCTPCGVGKFKASSGPAACTDCSSGTYSSSSGAVSAGTCVACPTHSASPPGVCGTLSHHIITSHVTSTCIHTYIIDIDIHIHIYIHILTYTYMYLCIYIYISIHLHTHKQRFSHACVSSCVNLRVCICVHENAASDASLDCACNAGYTGPNGGTCTPCGANNYKDATGPAACTACPANFVSPAGLCGLIS
jgi:hypothetical protein